SYYSSVIYPSSFFTFFFFNATAPTDIYPLSLHDALPIFACADDNEARRLAAAAVAAEAATQPECVRQALALYLSQLPVAVRQTRSEEHTSELQSRRDLVCRLLLEKKKKIR